MTNQVETKQLELYKALFKGRDDVYAVRWEKDGKSGYTPAYELNWDEFQIHKSKGGTIANFENKKLLPLTDEVIKKHLDGKHFIGTYPLLQDNTSRFISVDFDGKQWVNDCQRFLAVCQQENIPCYLERSRSGNGGHVWIFFQQPYPAVKSRKVVLYLLTVSGVIINKQKTGSFDRIFPNQDYHSGKGFGNLIALPLHNGCVEKGNNCFIDPNTLLPYTDQWDFLSNIQRISSPEIENLFLKFSGGNDIQETIDIPQLGTSHLIISLSNQIRIEKLKTPTILLAYLKDQLGIQNSEYWTKRKLGKSTWDTPIKLNYQEENEHYYLLPRGMVGKVLRFCNEKSIPFEFKDLRNKQHEVVFKSSIQLRPHQQLALDASRKKDFGIIVAPPGTGKTVMALAIIADKKQHALIIVHRKQLLEQWIERIQTFLGIPKHEIGILGSNQEHEGKTITVALIQSLSAKQKDAVKTNYGIIIVDECHHIPAESFREVITTFNSYYLYGLTATPFRKHSDEKALFLYLGDVIAEVHAPAPEKSKLPSVIVRDTLFHVPYNPATDQFENLSKILIHDTERNKLVLQDVEREVASGRKSVILTERKEHISTLCLYLRKDYEVVILNGDDSERERATKWDKIAANNFDVIVTTGQLFGEGTDLQSIESLFLVYPFSYKGKLVQYMGRVMRSEIAPMIYDYRDGLVPHLEKLFQKRNSYYRKLYKKGELKSHQEIVLQFRDDLVYINGAVTALPFQSVELPEMIQELKPDTKWLVRVLKVDENIGLLFGEILDYQYEAELPEANELVDYGFLSTVRFRVINTAKLLSVSLLKKSTLSPKIKNLRIIETVIKLPIEALEFLYGCIAFEHFVEELGKSVVFELENPFIRPEFEVLKPYFSKVLKTKKIPIQIRLEVSETTIHSQRAASIELDRINQEVVESLKFQFASQHLFKGKGTKGNSKALFSLSELEENGNISSLYQSEEELLEYALQLKNVKHSRPLRFLAQKHDTRVMKIRFILEPFSFVFLLTGKRHYYIIWETLNTEEATYVWHIPKDSYSFFDEIEKIDRDIQEIKRFGRQIYIETERLGFSRILHDYQDEKKGFIKWRDALEGIMN